MEGGKGATLILQSVQNHRSCLLETSAGGRLKGPPDKERQKGKVGGKKEGGEAMKIRTRE